MKRGVVIIGTGLIAQFHEEAVRQIPTLELVAKLHRDEAWDSVLSQKGVGLCLVANASGAHDEAVFAAARCHVPVLVEKPLAISTARAQRMIDACRATHTPLGCIFQSRWSEAFCTLKHDIEAGALGRLTYASIQVPWWRDDSYYTQSTWHGTRALDGGGALINQAIHMVDWLVALMPPVRAVKAFAATLAHSMEMEDTLTAALQFEGGALGSIYATTASFPGRPKRIELTGTKGTRVVEDAACGASQPGSIPCAQHRACIEAFVHALEGDAPYPIPGEEALKSIDLIERIYREAGLISKDAP